MTTWNYRVIKRTCPHSNDVTYQVHEVYYGENGGIDCWNDTPVEPLGISESNLRNDIRSFLGAFQLPVLEQCYTAGKSMLVPEAVTGNSKDLQADYVSKTSRASGYIYQILGNHLLLKKEPELREAYNKVDQALADLHELVDKKNQHIHPAH